MAAARGALARAAGYAAGQALSVGAAALLFRHLGVVDAGRYVTVLSLVAVVQGLADAGLNTLGTRELAVYEERWAQPAGPVCVALWGVKDPGNVGTVLRSARAFGAASVAVGPNTADPCATKAVRASMGAIFEVPVARVEDLADLPAPRVALVAREGEPLSGPAHGTLVVGAEREGLPADVLGTCDRVAHIPIRSESLNAAMAATVALYEMTRVPRA